MGCWAGACGCGLGGGGLDERERESGEGVLAAGGRKGRLGGAFIPPRDAGRLCSGRKKFQLHNTEYIAAC